MTTLVDCLLEARNSSEAIHGLFLHQKKASDKFSLAYLQRRAGISSRGYVSDIVSGRRVAHLKYQDSLPAALGLAGSQADFLKVLIAIDHADDPAEQEALVARRDQLRKVLLVERPSLPDDYKARQFFAFEVFCAFSLFKNRPTKDDLVGYFGRAQAIDVDYALTDLSRLELIRKVGSNYEPAKDFVVFSDSENGLSHLEFLKLSVNQALKQLDRWFPRKDEALIHSSMITVRRADYEQRLPLIKSQLYEIQTGLETSDADTLIRFNVQIYPVDVRE